MQGERIEKNLVLVGGGHAHVEVLRQWAEKPVPGVRLTLVSPESSTFYSGMLPGYIAGEYSRREITIDLEPLARKAKAVFYRAQAEKIEAKSNRLFLRAMPALHYDVISFDIGSTGRKIPLMAPLNAENSKIISTRPFPELLKKLNLWDEEIRGVSKKITIACVGAGAAGFELALGLRKRYEKEYLRGNLKVLLFDGAMNLNARKRAVLAAAGIELRSGERVDAVSLASTGTLHISTSQMENADYLLWAAGPEAQGFFAASELADAKSFLLVNDSLQSVKFINIFGAGDCINLANYPQVDKAGVFAVREGPILARNLSAALMGNGNLEKYRPQGVYLRLLNLGDKSAILQYGPIELHAKYFWKLKDKIDRAFMAKYTIPALPPMPNPDCGACGAKVGGDILRSAITRFTWKESADIEIGLSRPDDIALVHLGQSRVALSIDQFKDWGINPYEFGRIAAVHAATDIYAKGLQPRFALANIILPKSARDIAADDLHFLLAGAKSIFDPEGVELVGGQTLEGPEMQAGFVLLADAGKAEIWKKQGLRRGDTLILTKGLGVGIALAAAMRFAAQGDFLEDVLKEMQKSPRPVQEILKRYSISAVTDVTGFGFIGHLSEMLSPGLKVNLYESKIPVFSGVRELLLQGYQSRMAQENYRSYPWVTKDTLLYDPQTCGGFLFGITADEAEKCLADLRVLCPGAAIVGEIV